MLYWFLKNLVVGPIVKTVFRPWIRVPRTSRAPAV